MKKSIFKAKAVLCAAVLLGGLQLGMLDKAYAAQTIDNPEYPVSEYWLEPAEIVECGSDAAPTQRSAAYAVSYDPRNVNGTVMVSPIRDQGNYNTCWAFATAGAMEGNLIKNGYADSTIDLSENHFAYFFYHRQTDKLGYTKNDANRCSGSWNQNGGTLQGSGIALMTWAGMTTESKSPYVSTPDKSMCYQDDYIAQDIYYYNYNVKNLTNSVNTIKQAIMDHGAVASGIYFDYRDKNGYYNSKTGAYYYNKEDGNHAVTIVGWNDNYPRSNFGAIKPSRNGAWIVKNSYGTEFGDQGYNYVSYEDASLAEMMAVEALPAAEQYDNNYQHDGSANPATSLSQNKQIRCANVFKAKASSSYTELLKAVGICTYSTNTSYEIQIYTGLSNAGKPTSGTKVFSSAVKGTLRDAGYQTVELPKAVSLVPGEYFSIVVTLKTSSGKPIIAADITSGYGWIGFDAAVSKNQSFFYYKNKWLDCKSLPDGAYGTIACNLRIKGYTDKTNVKPSITLSKNLGVSKGSSTKLSLKKNPGNIYRTVKWKSSNTKVASVNSKGTVKGKSYGTATISATFVKSSKKTTLKCKVTVGPSKLKQFKVKASKGKVTVSWKKNSAAKGYEIYYSKNKDSGYKKLVTAKSSKKKVSKKLKSGTYYVKMRAYRLSGKKKLYGSYTAAKKVTVW